MTVEQRRRVAAYGVCVVDGKILLARWVGADGEKLWTMPGGGIDHGEDPLDAVVRELEEETGYAVAVERLVGIDSSRDVRVLPSGVEDDFHRLRIVYTVRIVGGELRDEVDGSTDTAAWFDFDEVAGLDRVDLIDKAIALYRAAG